MLLALSHVWVPAWRNVCPVFWNKCTKRVGQVDGWKRPGLKNKKLGRLVDGGDWKPVHGRAGQDGGWKGIEV